MTNVRVRVPQWPYAGRLGVLMLAAVLAGCDDSSPVTPPDPERGPRPEEPAGGFRETSLPPVVPRVGLDFEVTGAFRPGVPIVVNAVARGRRQADQMDLEVVVHDEPSAAGTPPEAAGRRRVNSVQGALGRGAERRVPQTITFASPGYYRVSARVVSSGPTPEQVAQGDSIILDTNEETLYILVDEKGGRLTDGFDRAALAGRLPSYGSYGPFRESTRPNRASASAAAGSANASLASAAGTFTYYIEYDNNDTGTKRPIGGTRVEIKCLDANFVQQSPQIYTTGADGSFSFTCPYDWFDGKVRLYDIYSDVTGPNNEVAAVDSFTESSLQRLTANNRYAAHVFVTLRQYVPLAEQKFGSRYRSRLPVRVSPTDPAFGPDWGYGGADAVRTNYQGVFGERGRFTTMHEYGHAYHWGAIEPWVNGGCGGPHYIEYASNLGCAFVEGFADFFAVWVAGSALTTGSGSDYGIETQTFYLNGEGLFTEGSVAGFLYDLVDGSADRDNATNTGATEETWDTAVYPGSLIADMIQHCRPYTSSTTTSGTTFTYTDNLSGADQLVYCLEGNVGAETTNANWRTTWAAVSRPNITLPTGYSTTLVRTLWKRNLYGTP